LSLRLVSSRGKARRHDRWSWKGSNDLPSAIRSNHATPASSIECGFPPPWHLPSPPINGRHPPSPAILMAKSSGNLDKVQYLPDGYNGTREPWSPYNRAVPRSGAFEYNPPETESSTNWELESSCTDATRSSDYTHSTQSTARSAASWSTAPSTAPPSQWPAYEDMAPAGNDHFFLWCEFHQLKGCNAWFRGNDETAWIQHHINHLKGQFPKELVCWFCDEVPRFVATRDAERETNFWYRMQHIRQHIYDHAPLDGMRPDFYMVEHMHKIRRIDERTYKDAVAYSELPERWRTPEWGDDSRTSSGAAYTDLEGERRRCRKRGGREENALTRNNGREGRKRTTRQI